MAQVARANPEIIVVDNYQIESKANSKYGKEGYKQVKDFVGSAYGAYRFTQLFEKTTKLGAEVARLSGNNNSYEFLKTQGGVLGKVAGAFIFPYFAFTSIDAYEAALDVSKNGGSCGRIETLIKKTLTCIVAACYSTLLFIPGTKSLGAIAQVADLGDDSIDLKQHFVNLVKSEELSKTNSAAMTKEIRVDLAEKKKQHLMGVIKAVLSVVGGIFGVLGLIYGVAVVPAIVALTISVAATVMSTINYFYKDNMVRHVSIDRFVAPRAAPLN